MHRLLGVMVMLSAVGLGVGTVLAADPMKEKEASPSMGERLPKDAIKGTMMKIDGEYCVIKENDGKQHKVHVDKSTKLDNLVEGDKA